MMRLIDADELTKMLYVEGTNVLDFANIEYCEKLIINAPTIDPVVHCAECRYAETFIVCGEPILTCDNNEGLFRDVPEDGYCYCGARMEGGEE